uniref:Uncharacterized protein n=1 Tax=Anguilla anguilla TaxID=7936 RepID=A0A0E9XZX6_ANGAN
MIKCLNGHHWAALGKLSVVYPAKNIWCVKYYNLEVGIKIFIFKTSVFISM